MIAELVVLVTQYLIPAKPTSPTIGGSVITIHGSGGHTTRRDGETSHVRGGMTALCRHAVLLTNLGGRVGKVHASTSVWGDSVVVVTTQSISLQALIWSAEGIVSCIAPNIFPWNVILSGISTNLRT
jgi:hypothetical protein